MAADGDMPDNGSAVSSTAQMYRRTGRPVHSAATETKVVS